MRKEVVPVPGMKPAPHGSKVVRFGNLVFTVGTGRNPATNEMPADIRGQTRQTLENIKVQLEAAGTSLENVLKMTCYLADIAEKPAFDEVYIPYFPKDPPSRACFQVASLGPGTKVEIECTACIPD